MWKQVIQVHVTNPLADFKAEFLAYKLEDGRVIPSVSWVQEEAQLWWQQVDRRFSHAEMVYSLWTYLNFKLNGNVHVLCTSVTSNLPGQGEITFSQDYV